jgi:hypothetical protein
MRKLTFLGVLLAFGLISATPSLAQPDADVWGAKGQYCRMYDPRTVETVSGEVSVVRKFNPPGKGASGVRFTLITKQGSIEAILGPSWYVDNQNFKIAPHDQLTVKGSQVAVAGKPTLIVTEVIRDGKTWKLRHKSGMPVWAPESGGETG